MTNVGDVTLRKGSVFVRDAQKRGCFMVDYLCDMGAFSKSMFAHVNIGFNISDPPGAFHIPCVLLKYQTRLSNTITKEPTLCFFVSL